MVQIKVTDDIDVVISEPKDTIESSFVYDEKALRPFDNESIFVWVNGVYLYCYPKRYIEEDAADDNVTVEKEFDMFFVKMFQDECKTIKDVLDCCELPCFCVGHTIYDVVDEYEQKIGFDERYGCGYKELKKMSKDELKAELENRTDATVVDLGTYIAVMEN